MRQVNLFITYNDYLSPIKDTSGISQNPFGEIQLESEEKIPVLYFFNEPQLGSVRQRELLQLIILSESWIIFCPVSLQTTIINVIRELLGRQLKFKRLNMRQNQENTWKKVLEQRLQPLVNYSGKLYYQFFKIDFAIETSDRVSDVVHRDPKIQWRRPLALLSVMLFITGLFYFLETNWQLLSIWSGRSLKFMIGTEVPHTIWKEPLIQKITAYTPELDLNISQNSLSNIISDVEQDRLTVGFGLYPQTLETMQDLGWSESLFMSGLVIVQKMPPDSLQPLSLENIHQFCKKIGYLQVSGVDTAQIGQIQRNLSTRDVSVLASFRMMQLINQLNSGSLDFIALNNRGIRVLGRSWDSRYLHQLKELTRGLDLSDDVYRLWRGFRLFIKKNNSIYNNLRTLNGKVGLVTSGTVLTTGQLMNRGLDSTRIQIQLNNDTVNQLEALNSGVIKAVIIPAIVFNSYEKDFPALKVVSPLISQEYFGVFFHRSRNDLKQKLDRAISILAFQREKNPEIRKLFTDQVNRYGDKVVDWFPNVR